MNISSTELSAGAAISQLKTFQRDSKLPGNKDFSVDNSIVSAAGRYQAASSRFTATLHRSAATSAFHTAAGGTVPPDFHVP